jgi:hypothetical protein
MIAEAALIIGILLPILSAWTGYALAKWDEENMKKLRAIPLTIRSKRERR